MNTYDEEGEQKVTKMEALETHDEDDDYDLDHDDFDYNQQAVEDVGETNEKEESELEWATWMALMASIFVLVLASACETLLSWANRRQIIRKEEKQRNKNESKQTRQEQEVRYEL